MSLLELVNLHKTFEKGTVNENHVLRGLDLTIEDGDFISVIGGNGAGKSTLLNCIAGLISIDQGAITLDNQSITKDSVEKRSKDISRVFQDPRMGFRVIIVIEANSYVNTRSSRLLPKFKAQKINSWCAA